MAVPAAAELPCDAIAEVCRKYRVAELSVFGSALRPDFAEHSDVDFLVVFEPQAKIGLEFVRLQRELSAVIGRNVDLVPKHCLKPQIREEVLNQARVVYAARQAVLG